MLQNYKHSRCESYESIIIIAIQSLNICDNLLCRLVKNNVVVQTIYMRPDIYICITTKPLI